MGSRLGIRLSIQITRLHLCIPDGVVFNVDHNTSRLHGVALLSTTLRGFRTTRTRTSTFDRNSKIFATSRRNTPRQRSVAITRFIALTQALSLNTGCRTRVGNILRPITTARQIGLRRRAITQSGRIFGLTTLATILGNRVAGRNCNTLLGITSNRTREAFCSLPLRGRHLSLVNFQLRNVALFDTINRPN